MKFEIVSKRFKDKTIEQLIIKMFEYFATLNSQREESARKSKNKEDMNNLLIDLCEYVEKGLRKKFSENFVVMINDTPNYAMKYDKNYFLALKYLHYSIIIIKIPYICIPGNFLKNLTEEEEKQQEEFYNNKKDSILSQNIQSIEYSNKLNIGSKKTKNSEKFTEEYFKEVIAQNISYFAIKCAEEKNLEKLPLALQHDVSKFDNDYNWYAIVSKKQINTEVFVDSCQIFYHCRIEDDKKDLGIKGLRDLEIIIFKRTAIFESVLKNILTGKLYEVELKHLVILISVVLFFIIMTACKRDYSNVDYENLSFFEEKVCLNKKSILSSIGLMFLFAVISGMIKKKLDKRKNK